MLNGPSGLRQSVVGAAAVAYESVGEHHLKGKAEPVPMWRALRITGGVKGALKGTGLEPPFVGRASCDLASQTLNRE